MGKADLEPCTYHFEAILAEAWLALDECYGRRAPPVASIQIGSLLFDLRLTDLMMRKEKDTSPAQKVAAELSRFLERLQTRSTLSMQVTLNGFLKLSDPAQSLLGSIFALETRGLVDDYMQIDFSRPDHHAALLAATARARKCAAEPSGRPLKTYLDTYFAGVTHLLQQIPNVSLRVSNHYSGQPVTPLETLLHLGHRLVDRHVTYHATVRAYHRSAGR